MKINRIGFFLLGSILLFLSGLSFAADRWCSTAEATVKLESVDGTYANYHVRTFTSPTEEAVRYNVKKLDIEVDVKIVTIGRKSPRGDVERHEAIITLRVKNVPFGSSEDTARGWNEGIDFEGPWKTEGILTKEVRCTPAR
jgi:hypothetical protein